MLCSYEWTVCADCKICFMCLLHCKKSDSQELQFEHICVYFLFIDFFLVRTHTERMCHFFIITFVFNSDFVTDSVLNIKSFKFIYSLLSSLFLLLLHCSFIYSCLLSLLLCIFQCVVFLMWFLLTDFSFCKSLSLFYLVFSHNFQISIIWKEIFNLIWLNQHQICILIFYVWF